MPKYSIIIPVRSINNYMKESIPHIQNLNYKDFEVIILPDNNDSYDFAGDTRFNIIPTGKISPGEKRNLGAEKALGEILAFLDDDAFPDKDWLVNADKVFADPAVYALGGPAITPDSACFMERVSGRIFESFLSSAGTAYRHRPTHTQLVDDYPSVNLFVRKKDFDKVGGYTKEFWPGEDTKLCLDLLNLHNRPFVYEPNVLVFHHRRTTLMAHFKQVSRYGQHRGQFARILPQTSRRFSYFVPSLFVLGLITGPVIISIIKIMWLKNLYFATLTTYFVLVVLESIRAGLKDLQEHKPFYEALKTIPCVMFGIIATHLVYGINFALGIIKKPKLKLKKVDEKSGNYIEG